MVSKMRVLRVFFSINIFVAISVVFVITSSPRAEAAPTCTYGTSNPSYGVYGSAQFDPSSVTLDPDGSVNITLDSIICNASDHNVTDTNFFEKNGTKDGRNVLTILDGTDSVGFFVGYKQKTVYVPAHSSVHLYWSVKIVGKASDGHVFFPSNGNYSIGIKGFGYVYDHTTNSGGYTNVVTNNFYINVYRPGTLSVYKHKIENGAYATSGTGSPPANADVNFNFGTNSANPAVFSGITPGFYNVGFSDKDNWYPYYYRYWKGNTFSSINSGWNRDGSPVFNYITNIQIESQKTTRVDVWYDPPPIGSFDLVTCAADGDLRVAGWAADKSPAGYATSVTAYQGNSTGTVGGPITSDHLATDTDRPDANSGFGLTGKHGYDFTISGSFDDGADHYIYMYAFNLDKNGAKKGNNIFIGKRLINCAKTVTQFFPWLQTKYGDVSAANFVSGQQYSKPGSREAASSEKEATNVIMATAGDQQFCSVNLYALGTNPKAQREQCRNGGYSENQRFSDIQIAINNAWEQNGKGNSANCNPRYGTQNITATIKVGATLSQCSNGTIYQVNGNVSLSSLMVGQPNIGRATIWVKGNLTIDRAVAYNYSTSYSRPEDIPNLAIYVEGEVVIKSNVTQLDAAIVSTGDIETCEENYIASAANCGEQLVVHGMLFGNDGFRFGRNFFNEASPNTSPAEKIVLTGQSIAFPPPGLDKASLGNNDLKIVREDNPRLK